MGKDDYGERRANQWQHPAPKREPTTNPCEFCKSDVMTSYSSHREAFGKVFCSQKCVDYYAEAHEIKNDGWAKEVLHNAP